MRLDRQDLDGLDKHFRVALINSISGLRPAVLVGTADDAGRTNLAIFNSLVHIGANPPLLGLICRPDTVDRHTLSNLRATGVYTVNHVRESFLEAAHQTSARYPRDISEFRAVGLTEHWEDDVRAPFVAEADVRVALELREELPVQVNGTCLVVGEIVRIDVPDAAVRESGVLDPTVAGSLAVAGLNAYFRAEPIRELPYAKVPPSEGPASQ